MSTFPKTELLPEGASLAGNCGILIPALDEEKTIAPVIKVALEANLGPVLVVDDGSADKTASVALEAGANVLRLAQNVGKGGAVYAGVEVLETPVVVLMDADLIGLQTHHIQALAKPVSENDVDMTRGVFAGGRASTTIAQHIAPFLNGQRGILKEKLLAMPELKESRYGIEVLITQAAARDNWRTRDIPLANVSQVMKEEKRGFWLGLRFRLKGYTEIFGAWLKSRKKVLDR